MGWQGQIGRRNLSAYPPGAEGEVEKVLHMRRGEAVEYRVQFAPSAKWNTDRMQAWVCVDDMQGCEESITAYLRQSNPSLLEKDYTHLLPKGGAASAVTATDPDEFVYQLWAHVDADLSRLRNLPSDE